MEITSCKNYTPNFQARPIAKTINRIGKLETKIDLWEISNRDEFALKQIISKTNMQKLMPNVPELESKRWKEMLEIAVDDTIYRGAKGYLAVTDNKPCGIMSFAPGVNDIYTSCVCTWPVEVGKKVKFAGKTLFYQLFKTLEESKAKSAFLHAIQNGPFATVSRYKDLGFNIVDQDRLVKMKINKARAKVTRKKLENYIEHTPIKDGVNVDLTKILDLD